MKKMLEDPKKKIFMLYPRFLQMILYIKHLYKHPSFYIGSTMVYMPHVYDLYRAYSSF
ncbi:hypothetical protein Hanom_Chr03g00215251 [Helianthus anomalus]